jgi:hypothetical protein
LARLEGCASREQGLSSFEASLPAFAKATADRSLAPQDDGGGMGV